MEVPEIPVEHAKGTFESRVALATAILAVALAFASVGGNYMTKELLLAQQQASNQWAFYQAKVIREHLYRVQAEQVELALAERSASMPAAAREQAEGRMVKYREEAERYSKEKKEIEAEAGRLERERDFALARDHNFELSEVAFQVAIILGSVTILSGTRRIFVASLVMGALATLLALNGFFLITKFP